MRPLNKNERLLAIALGTILFLFLNLLGMRWASEQIRTARSAGTQLKNEANELRGLLAERPYWLARKDWIAANPPPSFEERNSVAKFLEDVQEGVRAQNLKILSQQPLATERAGNLAVANIDLVLGGPLQSIVKWLHAVQRPGAYTQLQTFTLKQGEDGNSMQLQVRLGKIYRTGPATSAQP